MLQNKLIFNQSSVRLEIIGLPDYANNENKNQISIISQWKLMIIDKPLIEGNIDHLSSIMGAFYSYANFLINNDNAFYESKFIDIKAENYFTHNVLLKSSKPNVKPLKIKIGNSVLSDIINCFDQFNSSIKVRKVKSVVLNKHPKKGFLLFINKDKFFSVLLPPIISVCSLFLISLTFIYFYNLSEEKDKKVLINSEKKRHSKLSIRTII